MKVTKAKAERVLKALIEQHPAMKGWSYPPILMMKGFDGREWTILWEEGPYEWPYLFPHGGIEEEFGFRVAEVSVPAGLLIEPINHYSVGIYEA